MWVCERQTEWWWMALPCPECYSCDTRASSFNKIIIITSPPRRPHDPRAENQIIFETNRAIPAFFHSVSTTHTLHFNKFPRDKGTRQRTSHTHRERLIYIQHKTFTVAVGIGRRQWALSCVVLCASCERNEPSACERVCETVPTLI